MLTITNIMSELLFHITPTVVYRQLSDVYHVILNYVYHTDPGLIQAIRNGVILTVIIITTFSFFPGSPMYFNNHDSNKDQELQDQEKEVSKVDECSNEKEDVTPLRIKLRQVFWTCFILGSVMILQQTYHIPLGRLLRQVFPHETVVLLRIWNKIRN